MTIEGKVIFILLIVLLAAIEVVSGLLALRLSRIVGFALGGLGVFQMVALWLFFDPA